MDYGMIGKIDKAKRYAEQRDRIRVESLDVTIIGENNDHCVQFENGTWQCDCEFFNSRAAVQPYNGIGDHFRGDAPRTGSTITILTAVRLDHK